VPVEIRVFCRPSNLFVRGTNQSWPGCQQGSLPQDGAGKLVPYYDRAEIESVRDRRPRLEICG